MIRELGFSRTAVGSIYNAYFFVYLCLTPFTGILTDRVGARRVIATCSLFLGIGVLAVFYGATFPVYGACAGDYFPAELMGTVIGAWTPFYGIGAILAHWVGGVLRDVTGNYHIAFILNAGMAALGFVLFLMIKRRQG
jgi:MFS family permease